MWQGCGHVTRAGGIWQGGWEPVAGAWDMWQGVGRMAGGSGMWHGWGHVAMVGHVTRARGIWQGRGRDMWQGLGTCGRGWGNVAEDGGMS